MRSHIRWEQALYAFFVSPTSRRLSYHGTDNPDGSAPRCVYGVIGIWFCHPVSYYIPRWSLLYLGLYVTVFKECMSVLRKRRSRSGNHLVWTAVSLFILTTAVRFSLTYIIHVSYGYLASILSLTSCGMYRLSPHTWQSQIIHPYTTAYTAIGQTFSRVFFMLPSHWCPTHSLYVSPKRFIIQISVIPAVIPLVYCMGKELLHHHPTFPFVPRRYWFVFPCHLAAGTEA